MREMFKQKHLTLSCALAIYCVLTTVLIFFNVCKHFHTVNWKSEDKPHKGIFATKIQGRYYDNLIPLIFIGGVPRSGTTLIRAMLDAHPDIRCGQETRIIPRILQFVEPMMESNAELHILQNLGITKEVLKSATAKYILEVIVRHAKPAKQLCNKDPLTLKSAKLLLDIFPNAKFIFMVRDGRATVQSIISRHVTITGFNLSSYDQCMEKWNLMMTQMYHNCYIVGPERCMMVHYEQLVLHPEKYLRRILEYLSMPWNEAVLHHEQYILKPGGIEISKIERSTDQIMKPVNLDALYAWVNHFPVYLNDKLDELAPMLQSLGYDPAIFPPDYGPADGFVLNNTNNIKENSEYWDNIIDSIFSN